MVSKRPASTGHSDTEFVAVSTRQRRSSDAADFGSASGDNKRHQTSSPPQKHTPLCIVCKQRPQYSKAGTKYLTCGLTCGDKLESSTQPMCVVCGVRPRYSNGFKQYRTCGNECAAKDSDPSGSRMCDYCHQRPKFHDGRTIYPQCGKTCRDNARKDKAKQERARQDKIRHERASRATVDTSKPSAPSKTNSACLLCWVDQMLPNSDLCKGCTAVAEKSNNPVLLLEAPGGHATFNEVATQFKAAWKSGTPCPNVLEVYKIVEPARATADFLSYGDRVGAFGQSDNMSRRWHGITRQCSGFDTGNLDICPSELCALCHTIWASFDISTVSSGIYTSSTSNQANVHTNRTEKKKTVLLVDVVVGRTIELTPDQNPHGAGPEYDAVNLVGSNSIGRRIEYDELATYNKDAIKPLYVVVYS
ncbi:hypothetical protein PILCRDRAFT_829825 [Piloderma croceum F 1598]|uniref:PARP catalytic domain-containing protein n=1 Tax=Piloderma croceum (strain F 1598) TaxID=765440 RepID=A0A0C3AEV2_PILCF|nr:hypothetical protein PILCRDRAFT_829825 [Piloderma croceum F 1598]